MFVGLPRQRGPHGEPQPGLGKTIALGISRGLEFLHARHIVHLGKWKYRAKTLQVQHRNGAASYAFKDTRHVQTCPELCCMSWTQLLMPHPKRRTGSAAILRDPLHVLPLTCRKARPAGTDKQISSFVPRSLLLPAWLALRRPEVGKRAAVGRQGGKGR